MANYPYLVQTAWNVVNGFVDDWQKTPQRWLREIDLQTELTRRLVTCFELLKKDTVSGNYAEPWDVFKNRQIWSRIVNEPYIFKNDNRRCHPDIVIYDDIADVNSPPDELKETNWPILWACELKLNNDPKDNGDLEKLKGLIQKGDIQYGLRLSFYQEFGTGDGVMWNKDLENQKLWSCSVRVPEDDHKVRPIPIAVGIGALS